MVRNRYSVVTDINHAIYAIMPENVSEIAILCYPGCSVAAVAGLHEVFDFNARLRQRENLTPLVARSVSPDNLPSDAPAAVVVPPAYANRDYLTPDPASVAWLARLKHGDCVLSSACAGAFYLGAAGVLDDRRATTHWALEDTLHRRFPRIQVDTAEILISDANIITAGGLLSWIDLALELVARFSTLAIMRELGRHFVVDTGRREQRYYRAFRPPLDHGDQAIQDAQRLMETGYGRDIRISALASAVALSERSFLRRFERACGLAPLAYLQRLRVQAAQAQLEHRSRTIDQIAFSVGYENTNAFRKTFRRLTGLSPSQYRQRLQR
jgi:transcriptional regulator GlxA family with amidase domain